MISSSLGYEIDKTGLSSQLLSALKHGCLCMLWEHAQPLIDELKMGLILIIFFVCFFVLFCCFLTRFFESQLSQSTSDSLHRRLILVYKPPWDRLSLPKIPYISFTWVSLFSGRQHFSLWRINFHFVFHSLSKPSHFLIQKKKLQFLSICWPHFHGQTEIFEWNFLCVYTRPSLGCRWHVSEAIFSTMNYSPDIIPKVIL